MRIIAGEARGKKLAGPHDDSIRPALDRIRESLFSVLGDCFENRSVLDLFAGVGAFGLEALSRGARRAVFVDLGKRSLTILRRNIAHLGFAPRARVLRGDALHVPDTDAAESYALIFMDPPFPLFDSREETGKILTRMKRLVECHTLEHGGYLCLRHPSRWSGDFPLEPASTRKYGESTIQLFRGAPPVDGSQGKARLP